MYIKLRYIVGRESYSYKDKIYLEASLAYAPFIKTRLYAWEMSEEVWEHLKEGGDTAMLTLFSDRLTVALQESDDIKTDMEKNKKIAKETKQLTAKTKVTLREWIILARS